MMFQDPRKWIPFLLIAAAALIALAIAGTITFQHWRNGAAQAKVDNSQARAGTDAGVHTIEITGDVARSRAEIELTVKEGSHAIQSAPAGDSNDAALRAACGMRSYSHAGGCAAVLAAGGSLGPAEPDGARLTPGAGKTP